VQNVPKVAIGSEARPARPRSYFQFEGYRKRWRKHLARGATKALVVPELRRAIFMVRGGVLQVRLQTRVQSVCDIWLEETLVPFHISYGISKRENNRTVVEGKTLTPSKLKCLIFAQRPRTGSGQFQPSENFEGKSSFCGKHRYLCNL
jgi:hypothetical protein